MRTTPLCVAALVALCALSLSAPARADETYPSWADVEAARSTTATTQAAVERITALLSGLEATAASLGDAAIVANEAAATAQADSGTAAARAAALSARLAVASDKASAADDQLGRIGAQLYRAGSGGVVTRLLLSADGGADLLYQLGVTTRLGETAAGIQQRALTQANVVQSASKAAAAAAAERDRLARVAQTRASAAVTAQRAADEQLAVQTATADVLVAQLASLKNSTAETERSYLAGVAADEAYKKQQAEAARAAAAAQAAAGQGGGPGSAGTGTGGSGTAPSPGVVVDPAAARAYASSAVSARGWSQGEFSCLVSLWNRESSWRADAYNAGSGAYGIPQSLPGSKMASAGSDWRTNAATQIDWGLGYIAARYGNPCGAWAHSESVNWY
ncbi:hypothetical protein RCH16_001680 [Cryobacterium sp. MP_M5]|uniref:aggregation-promoting factor C-terminal-like domain-containing protein n=1 Tax=unclassified Cryobacterium TaxID=2649013 RepID=UPI0018C94359|nr:MULTISPECIES: hypothetical protein [unclassified Cryobacterium]MBG6058084.1 hypothetical protein [Cryobacterium sp. MP_M3]MEC5176672.1 hypothetical protein [Cryobacterium sp. MP_M5]